MILSNIKVTIVVTILSFIKTRFIDQIKVLPVKNGLTLLWTPLNDCVKVLGDADPNDKEQIERIWQKFALDQKTEKYSNDQLVGLIDSKIKDDNLNKFVKSFVPTSLDLVQALLDEETPDSTQIEKILGEWASNEDNLSSMLTLISGSIK